MTEAFDPYRKWLGISPKDQPPNHYRLLGIDLMEGDPDVIDNAADRQMTHVRTFQSGPHSKQSQQILNELAAARICLLSPDQKSAYDEQLRNELAELIPPSAVPPVADSITHSPIVDASQPPVEFGSIRKSGSTVSGVTRTERSRAIKAWLLLLVVTIVCAGLVAFILRSAINRRSSIDSGNGSSAQTSGGNAKGNTVGNVPATRREHSPNGSTGRSPGGIPGLPDSSPGSYPGGANPSTSLLIPNNPTDDPHSPNTTPIDPNVPPIVPIIPDDPGAVVSKITLPAPLPSPAELTAAEHRAINRASIAASGLKGVQVDRYLIARQLISEVEKLPQGSADRLATLWQAIEQAVRAGDAATVNRLVQRIEYEYNTDASDDLLQLVDQLDSRWVSENLIADQLANQASRMTAAGRFDVAEKLLASARRYNENSFDQQLTEKLDAQMQRTVMIRESYDAALASMPSDTNSDPDSGPNLAAIINQVYTAIPLPAEKPLSLLRLTSRLTANRSTLTRTLGGNTTTQLAVASGLDWILRQQQPDGSWEVPDVQATIGTTSLAMLPLLAASPGAADDQRLKDAISRGADFLGSKMKVSGGQLSFSERTVRGIPSHALATIVLCESAAISHQQNIKRMAEYAVDYLIACQNQDGGWGERPASARTPAAPSTIYDTTWNLMAVEAAQHAGISVSSGVLARAGRYIQTLRFCSCCNSPAASCRCSGDGEQVVDEMPPQFLISAVSKSPTQRATASGYLSLMWTDEKLLPEGTELYLGQLAEQGPADNDLLFNLYATWLMVVSNRATSVDRTTWNLAMRQELIGRQITSGVDAGSWNIQCRSLIGQRVDQLYSTCIATLILQSYYRYPQLR